MTDPTELEKIDAALQTLASLLTGEALATAQKPLLERRAVLVAGSHNTVLAERAVYAHGPVGGDIVTGVSVKVMGGASGPDPAALRRAYLEHLAAQCGDLPLGGIDPRVASEAEARLNLSAVYTALMTTRGGTVSEQHLGGKYAFATSENRLFSALEMLNRENRLVLLGDPGSGKSTFVNFVALCLAGEALGQAPNLQTLTSPLPPDNDEPERDKTPPKSQPWAHGALLPARVILRDFAARGLPAPGQPATAQHLWAFIQQELNDCALGEFGKVLHETWLTRGGLLLLDGLDEVPEAAQRRAQLKQAVEDFAATFRQVRVLVTSRTYAYQKQEWRLRGFAEAALAPFSTGQINVFVTRWYDHIGGLRHWATPETQARAVLLREAIANSARLRDLAERPLLLTLMASLHAWRSGSLPEKREELYADAVDLLLDQWERPKLVRDAQGAEHRQPSLAEWLKADRDQVRRLLNELAYQAHAAQPASQAGTADVPEGALVGGLMRLNQNAEVNPALLVNYLSQRAGLLLPRGEGVYTFPHRTFQEYLAACHLTDRDYPDLLARLARADLNRRREAALLAGAKATRGAASNIWLLAETLCPTELDDHPPTIEDWVGALLAGQALAETAELTQVSPRDQTKLRRVRAWLVAALGTLALPPLERARAGVALARLGDPRRSVVPLAPEHLGQMEFCYVPPGPFVMGAGKEQHENAVLTVDYRLARYPVTNAQFALFVQAGGYANRDYWTEAITAQYWSKASFKGPYDNAVRQSPVDFGLPFNLPNHPVVGMSWYEALAFCRWLTAQFQGQLPAGYAVRLPSEAEWEKAARGGAQILAQPMMQNLAGLHPLPSPTFLANPHPTRQYPWGDTFETKRANVEATQIGSPNAVGCFPAGCSVYGVEELSGNVWEWTRSLYDKPDQDDARILQAGSNERRVVRGGAFDFVASFARCAYRFRSNPGYWGVNYGFRCVVSRS